FKFDDVNQMYKNPQEPRGHTCKSDEVQIGNRGAASDRREIPFVEIMERWSFFAAQSPLDHFPNVVALLNGRLCNAGERFSGLMSETGKIADYKYFRMPGNRHVRLDNHASGS